MGWNDKQNNQTINGLDLIDAANKQYVVLKTGASIPQTLKGLTRDQVSALVYCKPFASPGNKLMLKSELIASFPLQFVYDSVGIPDACANYSAGTKIPVWSDTSPIRGYNIPDGQYRSYCYTDMAMTVPLGIGYYSDGVQGYRLLEPAAVRTALPCGLRSFYNGSLPEADPFLGCGYTRDYDNPTKYFFEGVVDPGAPTPDIFGKKVYKTYGGSELWTNITFLTFSDPILKVAVDETGTCWTLGYSCNT